MSTLFQKLNTKISSVFTFENKILVFVKKVPSHLQRGKKKFFKGITYIF